MKEISNAIDKVFIVSLDEILPAKLSIKSFRANWQQIISPHIALYASLSTVISKNANPSTFGEFAPFIHKVLSHRNSFG